MYSPWLILNSSGCKPIKEKLEIEYRVLTVQTDYILLDFNIASQNIFKHESHFKEILQKDVLNNCIQDRLHSEWIGIRVFKL